LAIITTINNFFKIESRLDLGNKFFLLGTFFLPTALPVSALFFIFSLLIAYLDGGNLILNDKWNYPLIICMGIIIFSTFNITFINRPEILFNYDNAILWVNLMNWLPIFFYFWGFKIYLKNYKQRISFSKFLISGTIPVILSFVSQKFFNFYGPFKTLFGLIVWFQKPLTVHSDGVSGLFSNPNYAGSWLALVLPFSILLIKNSKRSYLKRSILFFIFLSFIYMILMTGSRNALIGIIITFLFALGLRKNLVLIFITSSIFIAFNIFDSLLGQFLNFSSTYLPNKIVAKILLFDFNSSPRLYIWQNAISRIIERPFLGWGPSTFSFLHLENNQSLIEYNRIIDAQHSHNIVLETAHNFGIPLSIILISTIALLLIKSYKILFFKINYSSDSYLNKIWFISTLIFFINHLSDITFYDGKISLLICILLAGLKSILEESEKEQSLNIK
tara:strand:+ start:1168 stop:2505 length:1338 start_codon:yes stop_codon:yes gene_type:complete